MIKEKKIITEILPKSAPVSRRVVDEFKRKRTDGKVIYEVYTNQGILFCLNCEHSFSVNETGEVRCPYCGNSELRKAKNTFDSATTIRTLEKRGGFVVIKDTVVRYRESVTDGVQMSQEETKAIVVQGSDIALFEQLDIDRNEEKIHWARIRSVKEKHYYGYGNIECQEYDANMLEETPFADAQTNIQSMEITSLFNYAKKKISLESKTVEECPNFDEALINYPEELPSVHYEIYQREEAVDTDGVFRRYHFWCTCCGRYSTKVSMSHAYTVKCCANCNDDTGYHLSSSGLNYLITPQEFADGTLLLRVDEAYCNAYAKEPLLIGEACEVYKETTIGRTAYLYITLD